MTMKKFRSVIIGIVLISLIIPGVLFAGGQQEAADDGTNQDCDCFFR